MKNITDKYIKRIKIDYPEDDKMMIDLQDFFKEAQAQQLNLHVVSGSATDFESDLFDLINNYCKQGLKKPDLVKKMEWVLGSCKMS